MKTTAVVESLSYYKTNVLFQRIPAYFKVMKPDATFSYMISWMGLVWLIQILYHIHFSKKVWKGQESYLSTISTWFFWTAIYCIRHCAIRSCYIMILDTILSNIYLLKLWQLQHLPLQGCQIHQLWAQIRWHAFSISYLPNQIPKD